MQAADWLFFTFKQLLLPPAANNYDGTTKTGTMTAFATTFVNDANSRLPIRNRYHAYVKTSGCFRKQHGTAYLIDRR
jgi:hypothetical protein